MEQFMINIPINSDIVTENLNLINEKNNCGGQVLFLGTVRADNIQGKTVKQIEYSAYSEMAESELLKIKTLVLTKYDDVKKIIIKHSIGNVKAGENSLLVIISSGHRKQAFTAISEIVDLIKLNVPIWKKVFFEDDSFTWGE